jgi:hypothetical protein
MTGSPYPYTQYGKPTEPAYKFAEQVLKDRLREVSGHDTDAMPSV